jgi:hypothetical protein
MTNRPDDSGEQLSLDFAAKTQKDKNAPAVRPPQNVVPFVDATTLAIRRDAVRRVRSSGIFPAPQDPGLKT